MNILITGGTTGMGLLLAQNYRKLGHRVGVISFQPQSELMNFPAELNYFQADVTKPEQMIEAFSKAHKEFGTIDLVIASAGLNMPKSTVPDTLKGRNVALVNVMGLCHTFEAALPYFLNQKSGHFTAISSISSLNGLPGMSYYGASKAFVSYFCESLGLDLRSKNITITCVYPGFVATDFLKQFKHKMPFLMKPEKAVEKIMKGIKKKKSHVYFPLIPYMFMNILSKFPRSIYHFIMRRDILRLREE